MEQREYSPTALIRQIHGYPRMEAVHSHSPPVVILRAAAALVSAPSLQRAKASSCFRSSQPFLFLGPLPLCTPLFELDNSILAPLTALTHFAPQERFPETTFCSPIRSGCRHRVVLCISLCAKVLSNQFPSPPFSVRPPPCFPPSLPGPSTTSLAPLPPLPSSSPVSPLHRLSSHSADFLFSLSHHSVFWSPRWPRCPTKEWGFWGVAHFCLVLGDGWLRWGCWIASAPLPCCPASNFSSLR